MQPVSLVAAYLYHIAGKQFSRLLTQGTIWRHPDEVRQTPRSSDSGVPAIQSQVCFTRKNRHQRRGSASLGRSPDTTTFTTVNYVHLKAKLTRIILPVPLCAMRPPTARAPLVACAADE